MKIIEGRGKLYRADQYICDTRYYLTWKDLPAGVDAFTGRQTVDTMADAEGSLEPDERVFDVGEELQLELDNGARIAVTVTEGDSSDPLSAILVQVSGK